MLSFLISAFQKYRKLYYRKLYNFDSIRDSPKQSDISSIQAEACFDSAIIHRFRHSRKLMSARCTKDT